MKNRFNFFTFLFVVLALSANIFSQEQDSLLLIGGYSTNGLYGYINRNGEIVIEPKYSRACDFAEGVAVVRIDEKRFGFIDQSGNLLYECDSCTPSLYFSEGMNPVRFRKPYGYFFLDKFGNKLIDKIFEYASDFYNGFAKVVLSWQGEAGFINKKGELVIDTLYSLLGRFESGYTTALREDLKIWGILDTTGKFVPLRTNIIPDGNFSNGLIMVLDTTNSKGDLRKSKWGYLNTKGEVVIPPKYFRASDFSEGFAAVLTEKGWGYIDTTGKLVIKGNYAAADLFSEGLAAVYIGDNLAVGERNAFINKKGEVVIGCDLFNPQPFKEGVSKYWTGYDFSGDIEYIRKDSKVIWGYSKLH